MTTLVTLATKDCIVMGCDSLGSTSKKLVDPLELVNFFDEKQGFQLKKDQQDNYVLQSFGDIYKKAKDIPFAHMPHMSKLFDFKPLEMAIMLTGISAIGNRTLKSLIEEFKSTDEIFYKKAKQRNYSVNTIASKFTDFISDFYDKEFKNEKPSLEFLLCGFDKRKALPRVFRIQFPDKRITPENEEGEFGIFLGGQMKEIQRLIFGTDYFNKYKIWLRHFEVLREYRIKCNDYLKMNKVKVEIPELKEEEITKYDMFTGNWDLSGFITNWSNFSEQNAIECVSFFVNVMIKSQQFNEGMPTVGGNVHIALISKSKGVRYISKEQYEHEGHIVSKIN